MGFDYSEFLNDVVTIQNLGETIASNGGIVTSPTVKYANVSCSLQPIVGDELEFCAKLEIDASHVAIFSSVLTVAVGDALVYGADTYRINYWENQGGDNNPVGIVFAVYCKRQLQ